jgi:PAS domain-containing protein
MNDQEDRGCELEVLREIVKLLPAGVTVQDESGHFLLVNGGFHRQTCRCRFFLRARQPAAPGRHRRVARRPVRHR